MNSHLSPPEAPQIPAPPHALQRHESLPTHHPKSPEEDPEAPARIQAIMENFSYCQADQDVGFLNREEIRGVRLQLDYEKAELLLQQQNIKHTIVVFGSTRLCEPAAAHRKVGLLRAQLDNDPGNAELGRCLAVAKRVAAKSHYYEIAREFGRMVGAAGHALGDGQLAVMTGGGPGLMEAANRGAYDAGSKTIGLNINLPHEQYPNPYITPGLCFQFHYFALRKLHFLLRTKALVAFPGGYGTFDELFETLTLVQTRKIKPVPIILVGEEYWRRAFDVNFLIDEGVIDAEDRDLFWYAETAQQIWDGILTWYRRNGEPLLPATTANFGAPNNS